LSLSEVFLSPFKHAYDWKYLNFNRDRLLPHPFQFNVQYSTYYSTLQSVLLTALSKIKIQKIKPLFLIYTVFLTSLDTASPLTDVKTRLPLMRVNKSVHLTLVSHILANFAINGYTDVSHSRVLEAKAHNSTKQNIDNTHTYHIL
jgi:hypothetical protein